jgi:hypothetical protein
MEPRMLTADEWCQDETIPRRRAKWRPRGSRREKARQRAERRSVVRFVRTVGPVVVACLCCRRLDPLPPLPGETIPGLPYVCLQCLRRGEPEASAMRRREAANVRAAESLYETLAWIG